MTGIRVYHSFRSPYSRLGLHIIKRAGLDVELIPFTGPPEGNRFDDPAQNKAKLAYYMLDIPRMTMRLGLPIQPPEPFDVDLMPAYKASIAASHDNVGLPFALAVSDARWGAGRNVSDMDVIRQCAEDCGWSPTCVDDAQNDPDIKAEMKKQRQMIEEDQVFGVPFAVMGERKYWGHERFELLIEDVAKK